MGELELKLAILLDGGGRFVAVLRVKPDTKRIVGLPHTGVDRTMNDRMGLVADRLPALNSERNFHRRGIHPMQGGEEVLIFKEESA